MILLYFLLSRLGTRENDINPLFLFDIVETPIHFKNNHNIIPTTN